MKLLQPLGAGLNRLSPRERVLIGSALAIGFVMVCIYGVLLPGQAAARSAADRNARAAAELAEARVLASRAGAVATVSEDAMANLVESATARGLTVVHANLVEGAAQLKLNSAASVDVLAWAAEVSNAVTITSLSITAAREGGVAADVSFGPLS